MLDFYELHREQKFLSSLSQSTVLLQEDVERILRQEKL